MVVNNYFTNYFRSLNLGRNFLQESFSSKKVSTTTTKSLQSCPTLCSPMDCSLPGFSLHGILQARTLEWVAISFSNAWKWKVKVKSLGRVWLLVTPWAAAYQAPPSMGFSGQQYWSGVPLPSPKKFLFISYSTIHYFMSSFPNTTYWRDCLFSICIFLPSLSWIGHMDQRIQ